MALVEIMPQDLTIDQLRAAAARTADAKQARLWTGSRIWRFRNIEGSRSGDRIVKMDEAQPAVSGKDHSPMVPTFFSLETSLTRHRGEASSSRASFGVSLKELQLPRGRCSGRTEADSPLHISLHYRDGSKFDCSAEDECRQAGEERASKAAPVRKTPGYITRRQCPVHRSLLGRSLIALLLIGVGSLPALGTTSWEAYTYLPNSTQAGVKGLNALFERVRGETGGDFSISLHLGGSLPINATSITPTVADNIVQMGTDGFFSGNVPIAGLLRLPLLIRTPEEFAKAEAIAAPYIEAAYAKKGVLALGEYTYPLQTIWSRRKLASLADIKGQKLRVTSVEMGEFVKRFGGIPLTMGTSDVPAALDRGVIDGVLTATSGAGLTWKDLLKYNYRFPVQYANAVIIVNQGAFDALLPATQALLRRDVAEANLSITGTMTSEEETQTKQLQSEGLVVTAANDAEVQEAEKRLTPYWTEWAKSRGPQAAEALGKIRAALGR